MSFDNFKLTEQHKKEILFLDVLYRINQNPEHEMNKVISEKTDVINSVFDELLAESLISISDKQVYVLAEQGKEKLHQYGLMFQKFRDLAIFKCVFPEEQGPEEEGQIDQRFGALAEQANPPLSEDYRLAIFNNFCQRENRACPAHLFVFFADLETLPLHERDENWVFNLASGSYFAELESRVQSQLSADDFCPEGWTDDEIVEAIYEAGMAEMKRCFDNSDSKFDQQNIQEQDDNIWIEEVVTERDYEDDDDDYYHRGRGYYDPYWSYEPGIGAGFVVGAFAGLATCALLA